MKVIRYSDWDVLEVAEIPVPTPAPDEVLLRVAACGICGSELEAVRNRSPRRIPPLILGHEFCGTVAAVGANVTAYKEGQKVISSSLVSCNQCVRCRRGDTSLCAARQLFGMHRPGGFAEYVTVPTSALLDWSDRLPARAAALAEPLANGVHMVRLIEQMNPETVLIFGAGPIGLLALQAVCALTTATVLVADRSAYRLEQAIRLGATETILVSEQDPVKVIRERTEGEGADVVIDAYGAAITKRQSIEAIRPGGTAVWIGLQEDTISLDSYGLTLMEKRVQGTYAVNMQDMADAIALMASGEVDAESWTQTFPLEQGVAAFHRMSNPGEGDLKAVLLPEGGS